MACGKCHLGENIKWRKIGASGHVSFFQKIIRAIMFPTIGSVVEV